MKPSHPSIKPYGDTGKWHCPTCQRVAPKHDLLNPKLSHSQCFNPHSWLTRLGKPPKDVWQCQDCRQKGTLEYFDNQECSVLKDVCKYCGERPECSADCMGMFLALSDPDIRVIDTQNKPPLNRNPMDEEIRKLISRYKAGDESVGPVILTRMVRAGMIPERNIHLAAAYRFSSAIAYFGREPKEEEILTFEGNLVVRTHRSPTIWNLEIYVQRGLAAISQAYLHIKPKLEEALQTRSLESWIPFTNTGADPEALLAWIGDSRHIYFEARKTIIEWLERPQDEEYSVTVTREMRIRFMMDRLLYQLNGSGHLDVPELYYLLYATCSTLWIIRDGLESPGLVPQGAELVTSQSLLAIGQYDERVLGKPMFYGEPNRFRQELIDEIFGAICQSLVPILLSPFPF